MTKSMIINAYIIYKKDNRQRECHSSQNFLLTSEFINLENNRYNLLLKKRLTKSFRKVGRKFFLFKIKTLVIQSSYQVVELVGIAPASNDDPQ